MRLAYLLLGLVSICAAVIPIESIDHFYDLANNENGTYTVVKYYTQWCSHCKKLKGVYEELEEAIKLDNVQFLEVDCDPFGSSICSRLPGYPIVEVIKPQRLTEGEDAIQKTSEDDITGQSLFDKLKGYLWFSSAGKWTLEEERVARFEGIRNLEPLKGFIEVIVRKNMVKNDLLDIIEGISITAEPKLAKVREYYNTLNNNDITHERSKLEKILKTNRDKTTPELEIVKLQLELVNMLETELEKLDDEL
ncbi:protein disulfide isomerase MPD2 [Nakaseomyces bracarensis]|uniref:protein disulfide isomerase MPD2 n=1 Tax=Nakaseomyces bracarensis TaxID=273131 RepID=UPI003871DEAF